MTFYNTNKSTEPQLSESIKQSQKPSRNHPVFLYPQPATHPDPVRRTSRVLTARSNYIDTPSNNRPDRRGASPENENDPAGDLRQEQLLLAMARAGALGKTTDAFLKGMINAYSGTNIIHS